MIEHCAITVERGYCCIVPVIVDDSSPVAYSIRVYEYAEDCLGEHLLSMATAERESDAMVIAQALVQLHLSDAQQRLNG